MTITQRIFKIMDEKHIKQAELSRKTGISTSAISSWKTGGTFPSSEVVPIIAESLGVAISDLFEDSQTINTEVFVSGNCGIGKNQTSIYNSSFHNPAIEKAYIGLSEKEKLEVQIFILEKAAESEKSNATITNLT